MLEILKKTYEKIPVGISAKIINLFNLNPYYSKKIWKEIKYIEKNYRDINILDKELKNLGIKNLEELKNKKYIDSTTLRENFSSVLNKEIPGYYTSTGGTSGAPTKLYLSDKSYFKDIAHVVWGWNKLGYKKGDRKLTLRGVHLGEKLFKYNPIYNELQINIFKMDINNINIIIDEIEKFNPNFGHGYPTAFDRMAQLLKNKKVGFKLKGISLTSENISRAQKENIAKVFNCNVRGFWGHSERGAIAIEKINEEGVYEVPFTYGLIEIIKENGEEAKENEEGEVVCTGFINKGMKLIRYRTGDYATVNKKKNGIVVEIKNIIGRRGKDFVYLKNGEKISTTAINIHSNTQYEFKYIQFYQDCLEKVYVKVVPWELNSTVSLKINELESEFQNKLKGIKVIVKLVEEKDIYITHRGKIPYLISELTINTENKWEK